MVARSKELGHGALGLCDRDGLYGVVRAHAQAREKGHRFIVGAELSLAAPGQRIKRTAGKRPAGRARRDATAEPATVALLVEDHAGYTNLCRLLTLAHVGLPKGESWLELEQLAAHHEGLVAIVPGPCIEGSPGAPSAEL